MANIYKNAGFALSTTNLTTVYTVPTDRTAIVKSIQINNDDSSAIQTEISVTDSSASTIYKIYHKDLLKTINHPLFTKFIDPDKIKEFRKESLNLRFQKASGQLENTVRISVVRKEIARLKTIFNEIFRK